MNGDISSNLERISHQMICLRTISRLLSDTSREMKDVLNTLVHLLPEGWQFPNDTWARIILDVPMSRIIESANFQETNWKQQVDILIWDKKTGVLEVGYLEKKPEADEGPFLADEQSLIETVAVELGGYLERKMIERIREQQHKELELYASLLRHDLKNDVGVIIGNIEIAKLTMSERDEIFEQIITSTEAVCERMVNLLNTVGRASKIVETNIVKLIEKVAAQTEKASIGLKVEITVKEEYVEHQITESRLLPLVFDNLLRNAETHAGPTATIKIQLSREGQNIKIIVVDDGPGVPDEIREKLFQRGVSTRGGGMGLYLSKRVVETMGGSIQLVDSKPGSGATFEIILPLSH